MPAILAKKLGMTQLFLEDGRVERVTVLEAGPCPVTGIRTNDVDGYVAVQLAFGAVKPKHLSKPELGHLKKNDAPPSKHLVEFRDEAGELGLGRDGVEQPAGHSAVQRAYDLLVLARDPAIRAVAQPVGQRSRGDVLALGLEAEGREGTVHLPLP